MPKGGTDGVPIVGDVNIVGDIVGGGPISSPFVGFVIVVPLIGPSSSPFALMFVQGRGADAKEQQQSLVNEK